MFIKSTSLLLVLIYIDDIIITGINCDLIASLIVQLDSSFSLMDLGKLCCLSGVEVTYSILLIVCIFALLGKVHQGPLKKCDMQDYKHVDTPMASCKVDGVPLANPSQYRSIVGALQYVTHHKA